MCPPQGSAGEKTEKATPKKRQDARKEGTVLKSTEVNTAVQMVALFGSLLMFGQYLFRKITEILMIYISGSYSVRDGFSIQKMQGIFSNAVTELLMTIAPILAVAFVSAVVINMAQVGFNFTTKPLMPKFSKINPLSGFKRIFSMRSLVEMVKSLTKISVMAWVVYMEFIKNYKESPNLMFTDINTAGAQIFSMASGIASKACIAFVALGCADYLYQWWEYEKSLRMTKQEIKEEYKSIEGNPEIKGKIKQKQREMSQRRMMTQVPNADVVVTNPTHFAVALKYEEDGESAPVVLAKGQDLIAQKIKQVAREARVEIVENKPVAQALFFACEIGSQIPEDLYQAVAEILAYVYNVKNKIKR